MHDLLANADLATLEKLYHENRTNVVRNIMADGNGSFGDGAVFFRTAITEAARQASGGELPDEIDMGLHLNALALAHFRDWKKEKAEKIVDPPLETRPEMEEPSSENSNELSDEEKEAVADPNLELPNIPDSARLRDTRRMIYAFRKWEQLPADCKAEIEKLALQTDSSEILPSSPCTERYKKDLDNSEETAQGGVLPSFALEALRSPFIRKIRENTQKIESRLALGQSVFVPDPPAKRKTAMYLFIFLSLITLAYIGYSWNATKSTERVYNANFDPPQSLVEDMNKRLQNLAPGDDSIPRPDRPAFCDQLISDADEYYKAGDYRRAAQEIEQLLELPDAEPCSSDAYYYLGILGLKLEMPELTLQVFAKIEDIERFGDDIYWFQALAYIKIAEKDPTERETAIQATERAQNNTDNDERKAKATEMIANMRDGL